jgi:hypothetical protein
VEIPLTLYTDPPRFTVLWCFVLARDRMPSIGCVQGRTDSAISIRGFFMRNKRDKRDKPVRCDSAYVRRPELRQHAVASLALNIVRPRLVGVRSLHGYRKIVHWIATITGHFSSTYDHLLLINPPGVTN